jgi:tripartite-type tricarboxylate transporter receptor subunit TctC
MALRVSRWVLLAAPLAMTLSARAQDGPYPKAPVKIVLPAAPGGPTDVMARMIQPGQRVSRETLAVLAEPEVAEKLRGVGFDVRALGPKGLAARVAREVPMWRDVIQQSKIELQ